MKFGCMVVQIVTGAQNVTLKKYIHLIIYKNTMLEYVAFRKYIYPIIYKNKMCFLRGQILAMLI